MNEWLQYYELGQYSELFRREGYKWDKDFANMKALNMDQLKRMGVKKRGMWLLIGASAGFLAAIQHSSFISVPATKPILYTPP